MKMAVPELTFARVAVPEMGLTVCAGAGDVVQASIRQEMFRYCGEVGLYLGTDHGLEVSFVMEVKCGGEDDWLKLKASGSVVMFLDSAFQGLCGVWCFLSVFVCKAVAVMYVLLLLLLLSLIHI